MNLFVITCQVMLVVLQQCLHNKQDVQASHIRHAHDMARHSRHNQKNHNKQSHRIPMQRSTKYLRNTISEESFSSENMLVRRSKSKRCSCSCNQCNRPKSCCNTMCQSCYQMSQHNSQGQYNQQRQYNLQQSSLEDLSNMLVIPFPIPYLVYSYNETGTKQDQKTTSLRETNKYQYVTKASTSNTQTTSFHGAETFSRTETPFEFKTSNAEEKPVGNKTSNENKTPSKNEIPIETNASKTKTSNEKSMEPDKYITDENPTKTEPNTSKDGFKLRKATTKRLNPLVRRVTLNYPKKPYQDPINTVEATSLIIPLSTEIKNQGFHDITRNNVKDEMSEEVYYDHSEEPNGKQKLNDSGCDTIGNCYLRNWVNGADPVKAALRTGVPSNTPKSSFSSPLLRLRPTIGNPRNRRFMNNLRNRNLNKNPRTVKLRTISMSSPRRRYAQIRNDKFANRLIKD